ncbi:GNAT family N-acetyltransferase [Gimibacter soli]|uniref:GNAT family N-acetyltransferase n=1 Tax=Gimibacter soli TaxID=3024400 RepID=A0AAE9XR57_9PROT|nr:GNAT family N-acetyltransferase [Gimibacter soli]WCL55692.1 GNAT family N-acetyltransferase [Gimibacter soli]
MPDDTRLSPQLVSSILEIDAAAWDALAGNTNPFVSHAFLASLEKSGSVGPGTGWQATHLTLADDTGALVAAMPLYAKSHSYGEYVFDHGWADAYERAGGRYYPKLQSAVPFTPVTGPRLLAPTAALKTALAKAAADITAANGLSSLHATFIEPDERAIFEAAGYLIRADQQFHWFNKGYEGFDNFLVVLSSSKRKQIRKERRSVTEAGISFRHLKGHEITEAHWDAFFDFYIDTGNRKWGQPYLNRAFFSLIGKAMADRILLILAERDGMSIAGALNLIGDDTLYGRYWGCVEDHANLHFETCYYQAIDWAIAHGLKRVEAGAQGPHKLARGYEPVETLSAHAIPNDSFRKAVARFLRMERREVAEMGESLRDHLPFKKG